MEAWGSHLRTVVRTQMGRQSPDDVITLQRMRTGGDVFRAFCFVFRAADVPTTPTSSKGLARRAPAPY
jgi:hypothetical protein